MFIESSLVKQNMMESHVSEQKELRRHTKWFHMDDFIYQIVHIQSPRNSPDITAKIPEKLFEAEYFQVLVKSTLI